MKTYKAILKFDTVEKEITCTESQQNRCIISFNADNSSDTKLKLTLKTNTKTLASYT
jgi:hypothetical protein